MLEYTYHLSVSISHFGIRYNWSIFNSTAIYIIFVLFPDNYLQPKEKSKNYRETMHLEAWIQYYILSQ